MTRKKFLLLGKAQQPFGPVVLDLTITGVLDTRTLAVPSLTGLLHCHSGCNCSSLPAPVHQDDAVSEWQNESVEYTIACD